MTILRDLQERHFLSTKLRGHSTTLNTRWNSSKEQTGPRKNNTVHTSFKPTKTSISFWSPRTPQGISFLKKAIIMNLFLWNLSSWITLGTLSKDDDDGSENVDKKMNLRSFKLNRLYLDPLNMSNAGDFSWSWILKDFIQVKKDDGKFVVVCPRPP